jgi:serine/threonine protein kinase
MLYEMVNGVPPFHEGNIEYQHIHAAPPEITVGISPRLQRIIMRCIEKKPSSRFHSVEEILASII